MSEMASESLGLLMVFYVRNHDPETLLPYVAFGGNYFFLAQLETVPCIPKKTPAALFMLSQTFIALQWKLEDHCQKEYAHNGVFIKRCFCRWNQYTEMFGTGSFSMFFHGSAMVLPFDAPCCRLVNVPWLPYP